MAVKGVRTEGWTRGTVEATIRFVTQQQRDALAERVRAEMERRGWNNPKLAREAELSEKTISRVINARKDPRLDTLERIARAFGMEEQELRPPPAAPLGLGADGQLSQLDLARRVSPQRGMTFCSDPAETKNSWLASPIESYQKTGRLSRQMLSDPRFCGEPGRATAHNAGHRFQSIPLCLRQHPCVACTTIRNATRPFKRFFGLCGVCILTGCFLAGCGGASQHGRATASTHASVAVKEKAAACSIALGQYAQIAGDAGRVERAIRSSNNGAPSNMGPFDTLVADAAALQGTLSELRRSASPSQQAQLGQYQSALTSLQQSARALAVGDYTAGNADIVGVVAQVGSLGQLITSMCVP